MRDPSWVELNHFLKFLNIQLSACEQSTFCNEDMVGDVMSGLKTFVVKFMIRMSKVCVCTVYTCLYIYAAMFCCTQDFATSSLRGEVATENEEQVQLDMLQKYTITERKEWEKRYIGYMLYLYM